MNQRKYHDSSNWNDLAELKCLYIFKVLEENGLPRDGTQRKMCMAIADENGLSVGNLSAKVSNYKSVAGVNNESNASANTRSIYAQYGRLSSKEIKKVIESHPK